MTHPPVPGRLRSINVSRGGVPKTPVLTATITAEGLAGDGHRYALHGGPDRAVVLFSVEVIEALRAEGHPVAVGTLGENLTLERVDWGVIIPGTLVSIGPDVVLEITKYATPCSSIKPSFLDGNSQRVGQSQHPGWSRVCARVVHEGSVATGDEVVVTLPDR